MTNEMKSKIIYKISKQKTETEYSASVFCKLEIQTYERLL